jgi:hypothetical protein
MSYQIAQTFSFSVQFLDSVGADVDPTVVKMYLREEIDGTELEWTFDAAPTEGTHYPTGMNPIVKDSVGDYHTLFLFRKAERHTCFFAGFGNGVVSTVQNQRTVFVRHAGIVLVEP